MALNLRDTESREAQSRTSTKRKHWNPPSALDVPEAPDGFKYRWIRHEIRGQDDTKNIVGKQRQGYDLVHTSELPDDFVHDILPDGKNQGVVRVGDLVLAKIPVELVEERQEYVDSRTARLEESVEANLMKHQNPAMPISSDSKSSVTRGRPDFQED